MTVSTVSNESSLACHSFSHKKEKAENFFSEKEKKKVWWMSQQEQQEQEKNPKGEWVSVTVSKGGIVTGRFSEKKREKRNFITLADRHVMIWDSESQK